MDPSDLSPSANGPDAVPKNEVDDFLRRKRKVREHKACYPCRQRKVKCDLGRPCRTCVEREHVELCDYHPPAKRQQMAVATSSAPATGDASPPFHSGGTVTMSQLDFASLCRKLESVENSIEDLRRELRSANASSLSDRNYAISGPSTPNVNGAANVDAPRADLPISSAALPGFHTRNDLTGQTVYIGGSSVPALVMALGQGSREQPLVQEILSNSILPLFGLDNETATYPFVDLWGLANGWEAKAKQLALTIPQDSQCLTFVQCYRELGHAIYPGVADLVHFEHELTAFLMTRAKYVETDSKDKHKDDGALPAGVSEQRLYDKNFNWLGLLYAVLASGCQSSTLPRKERELTSQVYVCCSLECLRFTNFLAMPTLESVQALLVLGNVISNNMNAGTAWNLIGLTARLAQSLGLHQQAPPDTPPALKALRTKIWWTLMWQDSLLSISYDRASFTALVDHSAMADAHLQPGIPPFQSAMLRLCKVGLDVVRDRLKVMNGREQFSRISRLRDEISTILRESADHLRDLRKCRDQRDTVEHWALYIHVSYITSELCRPAITPSTAGDGELARHFRQTCIDSLANTVEAWLGLQNVTHYVRHSWATVHRALSSALLLGIMGEHRRSEHCRKLLDRILGLMDNMTSGVKPIELAPPMTRAIAALKTLRIQDLPPSISPGNTPGSHRLPPLRQSSIEYPSYSDHLSPSSLSQATTYDRFHSGTSNSTPSVFQSHGHPPRFIEDIALGGPSPRTDTSSPGGRHNDSTNYNATVSTSQQPPTPTYHYPQSVHTQPQPQTQPQPRPQPQQPQPQQQQQQQSWQPTPPLHPSQQSPAHLQGPSLPPPPSISTNPSGRLHIPPSSPYPSLTTGYASSPGRRVSGMQQAAGAGDDKSPYAVLNNIMWGNERGRLGAG